MLAYIEIKERKLKQCVVVHAFNPNSQEAKEGESLWVLGKPGIHIETLPQEQNQKGRKEEEGREGRKFLYQITSMGEKNQKKQNTSYSHFKSYNWTQNAHKNVHKSIPCNQHVVLNVG